MSATDTAALAAWRELAQRLNLTTSDANAAEWVRAVARLTGAAAPEPLFPAGITDQLPPNTRMVVMAGPTRSGKTVCGRRVVRQAIAAGRHATVIRTCNGLRGSDEYDFADLTTDQLTVIDAHSVTSDDSRYLLTHQLVYDGTAAEVVIIDASVPHDALRALVNDLHRQWLVTQPNATLVVLTVDASVVSENTADTRIVLPGAVHTAQRWWAAGYLRALDIDDLTWVRLVRRMSGGGTVDSRDEARVLGWFPRDGDVYTALAQHQTRIHEEPMPTTSIGHLQHGVLQRPDGALAEFALAPTAD